MRHPGTCIVCGAGLPPGSPALYHPATRTVRCLVCPTAFDPGQWVPIDVGTAGGSAEREYERRAAYREAGIKWKLGDRLGGFVARVTDEPQSTRAWARGARGEQLLAEALSGTPWVVVLNDRRVPGTRGNIDHIVIGPAGIFVVDAKTYAGRLQIRDVGGWFRTDYRLYVGGRDRSHLADNMSWQVDAVEALLRSVGCDADVTPVLCFIGATWPLFRTRNHFGNVRLEDPVSLRWLVTSAPVLGPDEINWLSHVLATGFPAK
jgi:Nuclease-related domain